MAIGRRPPCFFLMAKRLAPKKAFLAESTMWPAATKRQRAAKAESRRTPASAVCLEVSCCRWRGLIPSRPADEPRGMDWMAASTSASENSKGERVFWALRKGARSSSEGAGGVFSLNFLYHCCVRLGDGVRRGQEAKGTSDVSVGAFRCDDSGKCIVGIKALVLCWIRACCAGSSQGGVVSRVP